MNLYYVYILTNDHNTILYTGVTNDMERSCSEHKKKLIKGFTQKYNVDKLVYFEIFDMIGDAIAREKQIKGYSRTKKNALIDQFNNEWKELHYNGKIKNVRNYLLFSFSQGQGTALNLLYLCCVAQLVMRIITMNKIDSIYEIFVLLICIVSYFLSLNPEFSALKIVNLPGLGSLNSF